MAVLCGTTGGPATYGRKLVAALAATNEVRLSVLTDRADLFAKELGSQADAPADGAIELVNLPMRGGVDRLRWQHLAVPKALRKI
jgi:hypothetical protein